MRNLARELELSPNLNIELNNAEVLSDAVDSGVFLPDAVELRQDALFHFRRSLVGKGHGKYLPVGTISIQSLSRFGQDLHTGSGIHQASDSQSPRLPAEKDS